MQPKQNPVNALRHIAAAIILAVSVAAVAQAKTESQPRPLPGSARPDGSSPTSPAQGEVSQRSGAASTVSSADRKFIQEAAMGGMMEIELGKVALQRSSNDQVRQLARRIIDDHTQANDQLRSLAADKGIDVLPQIESKHQKEIDKLQKLSGERFDRDYTAFMVSDHKKDLKAFRREAKGASDSDLREFAAATLPKLEQHLNLAQSAKKAAAAESGSVSR
jgi:putative membrane protein